MRFPEDLETSAFRSGGRSPEYAWRRADAIRAVEFLAASGVPVLGGELWQVRGQEIWPGFARPDGIPGIYSWSTNRRRAEPHGEYVARCRADSLAAIDAFPLSDAPGTQGFEVFYNLTWNESDTGSDSG